MQSTTVLPTPYSSYGHSGNEKEHGRIDRPKGKDQHEEPRGFTQKGLRRFSK